MKNMQLEVIFILLNGIQKEIIKYEKLFEERGRLQAEVP